MKEVRYMISDTAKKVDVEAHVLRYWEEELALNIGRTEMGHRYYTPDDILLFKNIKELKEQGFQLKAIKMLLPELMKNKNSGIDNLILMREELNAKALDMPEILEPTSVEDPAAQVATVSQASLENGLHNEKIIQFQEIIKNIVVEALQENNENLQNGMGKEVSEKVIKEMDYMMRTQDEKEEERFRMLDETIRAYQRSRQEVALAEKEMAKTFFFRRGRRKKA